MEIETRSSLLCARVMGKSLLNVVGRREPLVLEDVRWNAHTKNSFEDFLSFDEEICNT